MIIVFESNKVLSYTLKYKCKYSAICQVQVDQVQVQRLKLKKKTDDINVPFPRAYAINQSTRALHK